MAKKGQTFNTYSKRAETGKMRTPLFRSYQDKILLLVRHLHVGYLFLQCFQNAQRFSLGGSKLRYPGPTMAYVNTLLMNLSHLHSV
jgi:hypothetical protein